MKSWGPFVAALGVLVCGLTLLSGGPADLDWSLLGVALAVTGAGLMASDRGETRPCGECTSRQEDLPTRGWTPGA